MWLSDWKFAAWQNKRSETVVKKFSIGWAWPLNCVIGFPRSFRVDSSSVWHSPARWRSARRFFCWMNHWRVLIGIFGNNFDQN